MAAVFEPTNQFAFACPIFGAKTKIVHCFEIRDQMFKGKQLDVRRGCQACISASKCPVVHIVKDASMGRDISRYNSNTPVEGKLVPSLLDRIAPVRVMAHQIERYGVDEVQTKAIFKANTTLASGKHADDLDDVPVAAKRRSVKPAEAPDAVVTAAQTGDMSAAITRATSG